MGMGWTREQASAIAAQIGAESAGNPNAVGDGGAARGLLQWHPDRQRNFEKWAGKSFSAATRDDQLAFINYELRQGAERASGTKLAAMHDPAAASAMLSHDYVRPRDKAGEMARRAAAASDIFGQPVVPSGAAGSSVVINQKTEIKVSGDGARDTAQAVASEQGRVNGDLVRNFTTQVK